MNNSIEVANAFLNKDYNFINNSIILQECKNTNYQVVFYEGLLNYQLLKFNLSVDKADFLNKNLTSFVKLQNSHNSNINVTVSETLCYDKEEFILSFMELIEECSTVDQLLLAAINKIDSKEKQYYTILVNDGLAYLAHRYYCYNRNIQDYNSLINFLSSEHHSFYYCPLLLDNKGDAIIYGLLMDTRKRHNECIYPIEDIKSILSKMLLQYSLGTKEEEIANSAPFFFSCKSSIPTKTILKKEHCESVFYLGKLTYNNVVYELSSICSLEDALLLDSSTKNHFLLSQNIINNILIIKHGA
jgi:hypothetical protein